VALDAEARVRNKSAMLHRLGSVRAAVRGGVIASLVGYLFGCGAPSAERVQSWKATPEGRERLVATLRDAAVPVPLRAQAAAALTEVGWVDRVESAVAGMPLDQRAPLVPALASAVAPQLDARDAGQAWDAREVLLALRRHATTDDATRVVDGFLLPALERDLRAGRKEGGRHTLKEMLTSLGPAALPVLTRVVGDEKAPLDLVVELLEKIGDKPARDAASEALVKRARAANPVPPDLWKALSKLGGAAAVSYLQEAVEKGTGQTQLEAATALAQTRPEATLLPFALKVAKDLQRPVAVREQALTLAERIGSEAARKGMVEIITFDPDPEFRYKTFAKVVTAGSGKQLLPALEAFPPRAAYQPDELRTRVVEPIAKIGYGGRPDIMRALESKSPLARLVAIWVLEKSNFGSDAPQVQKLTKDQGVVRGLPPGTTIGSEATRIATALKKQAT
jgi:hypothetical protein